MFAKVNTTYYCIRTISFILERCFIDWLEGRVITQKKNEIFCKKAILLWNLFAFEIVPIWAKFKILYIMTQVYILTCVHIGRVLFVHDNDPLGYAKPPLLEKHLLSSVNTDQLQYTPGFLSNCDESLVLEWSTRLVL